MKTMCLLSFPKVIFFPHLPSPHLSFPPSSFSSCSSSSRQHFCLAENCSSCCDTQPLRKPQVELAKAYSQSLAAQFPPPWSAVAFVVLGLPVQALPTVGSVYRVALWWARAWSQLARTRDHSSSHSRDAPGLSVPYQEWATRYVQAWIRNQMSL